MKCPGSKGGNFVQTRSESIGLSRAAAEGIVYGTPMGLKEKVAARKARGGPPLTQLRSDRKNDGHHFS